MSTDTRTEFQKGIDERVMNGVLAMERKFGPEWLNLIDERSLDLADPWSCVLGQAYGDGTKKGELLLEGTTPYHRGVEELSAIGPWKQEGLQWAKDRGFLADREAYSTLTKRWKLKLKELKKKR